MALVTGNLAGFDSLAPFGDSAVGFGSAGLALSLPLVDLLGWL